MDEKEINFFDSIQSPNLPPDFLEYFYEFVEKNSENVAEKIDEKK